MSEAHLLPPLPSNYAIKLGANPIPVRNSDFGSYQSFGDIVESESSLSEVPQVLPLVVCKHCEDSLQGAFNHCLSKHGDYMPLDSTYEIDEEQDGILKSEPPYFNIIKDPIKSSNPVFENPQQRIERDRWVAQQKRHNSDKLDLGKPKIKGLGVKTGKNFSGALYKRMLEAKEREITTLRKELYETVQRGTAENDNVTKLKRALNKSVKFYTLAEEWQQGESSKLQEDIRRLKCDVSSLMAILINSEVQKQNVLFVLT
jgi:hypothetical protein